MKNVLMMLMSLGITASALATGPRVVGGGPKVVARPSKVVVVRPHGYGFYPSYGYGYNSFYPYSGYGFGSFYSPFIYNQQEPSKLDLDIEEINSDFHHDIADVRHDHSLSKEERKQKIRDLRNEKSQSIIDAKKDYYKSGDNDDVE